MQQDLIHKKKVSRPKNSLKRNTHYKIIVNVTKQINKKKTIWNNFLAEHINTKCAKLCKTFILLHYHLLIKTYIIKLININKKKSNNF